MNITNIFLAAQFLDFEYTQVHKHRIHMDPQPEQRWECATCSKTFKTKSYLTAHMVTHDPDAKVTCEVRVKIDQSQTNFTIQFSHVLISVLIGMRKNIQKQTCLIQPQVVHSHQSEPTKVWHLSPGVCYPFNFTATYRHHPPHWGRTPFSM